MAMGFKKFEPHGEPKSLEIMMFVSRKDLNVMYRLH